jgi:hypothetical protein
VIDRDVESPRLVLPSSLMAMDDKPALVPRPPDGRPPAHVLKRAGRKPNPPPPPHGSASSAPAAPSAATLFSVAAPPRVTQSAATSSSVAAQSAPTSSSVAAPLPEELDTKPLPPLLAPPHGSSASSAPAAPSAASSSSSAAPTQRRPLPGPSGQLWVPSAERRPSTTSDDKQKELLDKLMCAMMSELLEAAAVQGCTPESDWPPRLLPPHLPRPPTPQPATPSPPPEA